MKSAPGRTRLLFAVRDSGIGIPTEKQNRLFQPFSQLDASSTRREDLLLGRDELNIIWKLRRALSGLDDQAALETLKSRMTKTHNNHDFLLSVLKTTPAQEG